MSSCMSSRGLPEARQCELDVGSLVQLGCVPTGYATPEAAYRIEQRLKLDDGALLYKVRCEAEPFDRIVAAGDLMRL